jgi:hypothetical protein
MSCPGNEGGKKKHQGGNYVLAGEGEGVPWEAGFIVFPYFKVISDSRLSQIS